jgi:2-oxoglutarate ferredoxin oxidoreductase subunit delta
VKGRIEIDSELCKGCGLCINVCPKKQIEISDNLNKKGYYPARYKEQECKDTERKCTGCAMCALTCPDIAIDVYKQEKKKQRSKKDQSEEE